MVLKSVWGFPAIDKKRKSKLIPWLNEKETPVYIDQLAQVLEPLNVANASSQGKDLTVRELLDVLLTALTLMMSRLDISNLIDESKGFSQFYVVRLLQNHIVPMKTLMYFNIVVPAVKNIMMLCQKILIRRWKRYSQCERNIEQCIIKWN